MTRPRTPPDQLNEIYPNLYLGDLTAAESPHVLEAYAITHIISLTSHRPKVPKGLGITKKHFRIRDNTTSNLLSVLPECVKRLEYILGDEDGGVDEAGRRRRVLVHCRMGMSRSGGAVVAYVMKFAQCPAIVALEYVRQMRPIVNPNRAFMAQLELWGACSYDTSFLEDHEKHVLSDNLAAVDSDGDDDLGEEALLMRALEMSLENDVDVDDSGAVAPEDDAVEENTEVDSMHADDVDMDAKLPIPDGISDEPVPASAPLGGDVDMDADPLAGTQSPGPTPSRILDGPGLASAFTPPDTPMEEDKPAQPEDIPLPHTPEGDTKTGDLQLQLEARRQNMREQHEDSDDGAEAWGQVVMRDGMRRCFEDCLKHVGSGVEGVS